MTRIKLLVALIVAAFSTATLAGPGYYLIANANAETAKKQEAKKEVKKAPAKKKEDGKIKPLDPNRKVPTLKKKYKKED
jgi:hypothetical protein